MMLRLKICFLITTLFIRTCSSSLLAAESSIFTLNTRLSFYSYEKSGEMLLHIPSVMQRVNLAITIKVNGISSAAWNGIPGKEILRIPFNINLSPGEFDVEASIIQPNAPGSIFRANTKLIILSPKSNEVKTDRLTGGLIVNRRQFFPFGFYCYSPVNPLMPEEEVVRGFNMMSPYQKITP